MTVLALAQPIIFRTSSTRWCPAVIAKIISGTTVNLDAFIDTAVDWPVTNIPVSHPCHLYESVAMGTGVGEWQLADVPEPVTDAIDAATAGLATTGYVDTAVAGLASTSYVDTAVAGVDLAGRTAVAGAGVSQLALGLDAARQPSLTRPTRVTATGTIALTSTLITPQSATVELASDSATTPTTVRGSAPATLSGVVASLTLPWSLTYDVPAGHYYLLATSGAGTVALLTLNETAG